MTTALLAAVPESDDFDPIDPTQEPGLSHLGFHLNYIPKNPIIIIR